MSATTTESGRVENENSIVSKFKSILGITVSLEWLDACRNSLRQTNRNPNDENSILRELLNADLRCLVVKEEDNETSSISDLSSPALSTVKRFQRGVEASKKEPLYCFHFPVSPPQAQLQSIAPDHPETTTSEDPPFKILLQIEELLDVSINAEARLMDGPASLAAPSPVGSQRRRCLKFLLSDGSVGADEHNRETSSSALVGMEVSPIANLSVNSLPGTKILVRSPLTMRLGVLLLNEGNTTVLGGCVPALRRIREKAHALAQKNSMCHVDPTVRALINRDANFTFGSEGNDGDEDEHDVSDQPSMDVDVNENTSTTVTATTTTTRSQHQPLHITATIANIPTIANTNINKNSTVSHSSMSRPQLNARDATTNNTLPSQNSFSNGHHLAYKNGFHSAASLIQFNGNQTSETCYIPQAKTNTAKNHSLVSQHSISNDPNPPPLKGGSHSATSLKSNNNNQFHESRDNPSTRTIQQLPRNPYISARKQSNDKISEAKSYDLGSITPASYLNQTQSRIQNYFSSGTNKNNPYAKRPRTIHQNPPNSNNLSQQMNGLFKGQSRIPNDKNSFDIGKQTSISTSNNEAYVTQVTPLNATNNITVPQNPDGDSFVVMNGPMIAQSDNSKRLSTNIGMVLPILPMSFEDLTNLLEKAAESQSSYQAVEQKTFVVPCKLTDYHSDFKYVRCKNVNNNASSSDSGQRYQYTMTAKFGGARSSKGCGVSCWVSDRYLQSIFEQSADEMHKMNKERRKESKQQIEKKGNDLLYSIQQMANWKMNVLYTWENWNKIDEATRKKEGIWMLLQEKA